MKTVIVFFKNFFLTTRFFVLLGGLIVAFLFSYFYPWIFGVAKLSGVLILIVLLLDILMLWAPTRTIQLKRFAPPRLSNGDDNLIRLFIRNRYPFPVKVLVIDELPVLLQIRDLSFKRVLNTQKEVEIDYQIRPVVRGEYLFGRVHALTSGPLGLVSRRISKDMPLNIPCYPSFVHLRKYELMAVSDKYEDSGHRRINAVGRSYEFDHIRNYSLGDDIRSINWKATARRDLLMINQYREEKSQQIYCVIDAGRTMKSPFEGMTLLDYAINATLVLSDVAVVKNDKAGMMVFSDHIHTLLPCNNRRSHVGSVMEHLFNARTDFSESSFELMTATLIKKIPRRSLIVLFTNFEGRVSLHRQLPFLRQLSRNHLVLTVFFENSLLHEIAAVESRKLSDVYVKTLAEKHLFERKFIAEDLSRAGIIPLLTSPSNLTVDAVNKYVEIKARKLI